MPRLFYKVVVALAFVVVGLAVLAAEVALIVWLSGQYPNVFAWAAFVVLGLVDGAVVAAVWDRAVGCVKAA